MIDKQPSPGNWTWWVERETLEGPGNEPARSVDSQSGSRESKVLGPDGKPFMVGVPRHRLGFDLSRGK